MNERRRRDRKRSFLAGTLAYDDRRVTLECVVRDLSDHGALLLIHDPPGAPRELDLSIDALGGDRRRARVIWRGETGVGVVFVSAERHNVIAFPAERTEPRTPEADRERLMQRIARFVRPREHRFTTM